MNNLPMIANRVEEKIQDVELVIDQRDKRIFRTGLKEAIPKITQILYEILPLYGIEAKEDHLIELTDFISRHKLISPDEIKLAFEKFARFELKIDNHKLYGKVDLHAIGRILNAYIEWRQKIYHAMDTDLQKKLEEEKRAKKLKTVAEEYDRTFDDKLKNFKGTLEDIPAFWYETCLKRGYINMTDEEKETLWEEAKQLALKEKPSSDNYMDIKSHMRKIEEGNLSRAKVLAFKLAVWRKVLLRD